MLEVSPRGPYSIAATDDNVSTPALAEQACARSAVP